MTCLACAGGFHLQQLLPVIKFSLILTALAKALAPEKFAELAFNARLLNYGQQLLQMTAIVLILASTVFHVLQVRPYLWKRPCGGVRSVCSC